MKNHFILEEYKALITRPQKKRSVIFTENKAMKRKLSAILFFYFVFIASTFSQIFSILGSNLLWNNPATWYNGVVPTAGDTVYITIGSSVILDNMPALVSEVILSGHLDITANNSSALHVTHSFLVSVPGNLLNNGKIFVDDNFYNQGAVGGFGKFCVSDSTLNDGTMGGSFDFCDLTPPGLPPYIDMNTGTVDPGITYCMAGLCGPARVQETNEKDFFFVTTESSSMIIIHLPSSRTNSELRILDATGSVCYQRHIQQNELTISVSEKLFSPGLYFFVLSNANGTLTRKMLLD